jgi:hypothetical protein
MFMKAKMMINIKMDAEKLTPEGRHMASYFFRVQRIEQDIVSC